MSCFDVLTFFVLSLVLMCWLVSGSIFQAMFRSMLQELVPVELVVYFRIVNTVKNTIKYHNLPYSSVPSKVQNLRKMKKFWAKFFNFCTLLQ